LLGYGFTPHLTVFLTLPVVVASAADPVTTGADTE